MNIESSHSGFACASSQPLPVPAGLPSRDGGPVFSAPWEAQAFAMVHMLHERGLFTWSEWVSVMAQTIQKAQQGGDQDLGDTYYLHWLGALEHMLVLKRVVTPDLLSERQDQWDEAARRTPHGQPIVLGDT